MCVFFECFEFEFFLRPHKFQLKKITNNNSNIPCSHDTSKHIIFFFDFFLVLHNRFTCKLNVAKANISKRQRESNSANTMTSIYSIEYTFWLRKYQFHTKCWNWVLRFLIRVSFLLFLFNVHMNAKRLVILWWVVSQRQTAYSYYENLVAIWWQTIKDLQKAANHKQLEVKKIDTQLQP